MEVRGGRQWRFTGVSAGYDGSFSRFLTTITRGLIIVSPNEVTMTTVLKFQGVLIMLLSELSTS